jgi:hypothetical protein
MAPLVLLFANHFFVFSGQLFSGLDRTKKIAAKKAAISQNARWY